MKELSGIREDKHSGFWYSGCRLSEEQYGMLSDESAKNSFSSQKAGVAWMKAKFNVTYSESGLGLLFARLEITSKCRALWMRKQTQRKNELAPCSPELNAVERIFEWICNEIEDKLYPNIGAKKAAVEVTLKELSSNVEQVCQFVGWDWIMKSFEALKTNLAWINSTIIIPSWLRGWYCWQRYWGWHGRQFPQLLGTAIDE